MISYASSHDGGANVWNEEASLADVWKGQTLPTWWLSFFPVIGSPMLGRVGGRADIFGVGRLQAFQLCGAVTHTRAQLASFCTRKKSRDFKSLVLLILFQNGETGVFEAAVSFHFAINFFIVIPMECSYLVVGGRSLP